MAKTIIIKNFPEDLHRKAKAKAALEGITLKALIIKLLETYLKNLDRTRMQRLDLPRQSEGPEWKEKSGQKVRRGGHKSVEVRETEGRLLIIFGDGQGFVTGP